MATIPSGEAVKAPGGALHGTNSNRIVVLALGLDRLTCIQRDSPDPLRWDPPWLSKRALFLALSLQAAVLAVVYCIYGRGRSWNWLLEDG